MLMWPGGDLPDDISNWNTKDLQNTWITVPLKKKKTHPGA